MENDIQRLQEAWNLLETLTPLKNDCGRLCGAACCEGSEAGEGMLLFPGEDRLMTRWDRECFSWTPLEGFGPVGFFTCGGQCHRGERPLACRIFPLSPRLRQGVWGSRMDARARPICPLAQGPKGGLDSRFVAACEEAFRLLAQSPRQAQFMEAWARQEAAFRQPFL